MKHSKTFASLVMLMVFPTAVLESQQNQIGDDLAPVDFLEWREIGPSVVGGRISDLAIDPSNKSIIYVGTATAGVWKSTNHGTTWDEIFTDEVTSSIGDITLSPSNPNIVWVGTGEPQNRQSSPWGHGVFKSLDAGQTWQFLGLEETRHISRIRVHPTNPQIAYVAAVGNLWKPNPERGVFKTTDGGATWKHVLHVDDYSGAIDLVMDPKDPNTLFVAMYTRQRTAWGFNGGGAGSGIYRTLDGGTNWTRLEEGIPTGHLGRIGLDVYHRNGNILVASIEARRGQTGVYGSKDRGDSWTFLSDTNPRPMYFSMVRIDPNDPERIYMGGQNLMRSDDGGKTFSDQGARNVHLDHHALWIDPDNSNHLILGSDGGLSVSFDRSENWRFYDNLPISQFYEIGLDQRDPFWVCGGLQDNGSWCGPSKTLDSQGIRNADWVNISGGDGFYVQIDPENPNVAFSESQNGRVSLLNLETGERASIAPRPLSSSDEGSLPRKEYTSEDDIEEDEREYRFNWNTPILLSQTDSRSVYVGSQMLLKSTDNGISWTQMSPDLTYNIDRSQLSIMDELPSDSMLSMHDGVSFYSTLTTIDESSLNTDVFYTGSDDGRVMGTTDGGLNWSDLTDNIPGLPDNTYVSRIIASKTLEGRVYATFDGHYSGDFQPYVYRSDDFGEEWTSIISGLPESSVNVILEHPEQENLVFVGSEVGIFVSIDAGATWTPLMNGLPTVPVDDIKLHHRNNDLVIGTHGRGIWILDNITPLVEIAENSVQADSPYLFQTGVATQWRTANIQEWTGSAEFRLNNPTNDVRIRYWIPEGFQSSSDMEFKIMTTTGQEIRSFSEKITPGSHEVLWDYRMNPAFVDDQDGPGNNRFRGGPRAQGPMVMPGIYQIQVEVGQVTMFGDVMVQMDPRVEISNDELESRQEALMSIYRLQKPVFEATQAVQRLEEQLEEAVKLIKDTDDSDDSLSKEAEQMMLTLEDIRKNLTNLPMGVGGSIEGSHTLPTQDQLEDIERAWEDGPEIIEDLNFLISNSMPQFYQSMNTAGIRADPGNIIRIPR